MPILPTLCLALYFLAYAFESVLRYGLHLIGHDALIFARDAVLVVPLACLFAGQWVRGRVQPAYIVFFCIVLLHGTIMLLNTGSMIAVLYGAKVLMTLLAGAVLAPCLFTPRPAMVRFLLFLWLATLLGVVLDKYFVTFPWSNMETTIGDVQVDISRNWEMVGADKRAGGFMRSSIHVAAFAPLLAILLLFNLRSRAVKALVALGTLPILYWTTQKGPTVAYAFMLLLLITMPKQRILLLKTGFFCMLTLCILLPTVLPYYLMPSAQGVFSFSSFYERVEAMWPHAWAWIRHEEAFPFGVGLGGIGGAQRFYAPAEVNAADNIFVFLYAYFGVMAFLYVAWLARAVLNVPNRATGTHAPALAMLVFLFGYGCVISIIEDQMTSLFLGAAAAWLARNEREGA